MSFHTVMLSSASQQHCCSTDRDSYSPVPRPYTPEFVTCSMLASIASQPTHFWIWLCHHHTLRLLPNINIWKMTKSHAVRRCNNKLFLTGCFGDTRETTWIGFLSQNDLRLNNLASRELMLCVALWTQQQLLYFSLTFIFLYSYAACNQ